jgi:hypothetical protein
MDAAACILAAFLRLASRCSSEGGARHMSLPMRRSQFAQVVAGQYRTSCGLPAQQSRHLARIVSLDDSGSRPIASSSSRVIVRGSRPTM